MADSVAPAKSPAKKKATKPKVPAAHPKYIDMISAAVSALKERGGSSRQAILKYIMANYKVGNDANFVNAHLKMALKNGVKKGALKQAKGTGASGSFKLGEKPKTEKKPKAKKVAKPKAAKLKKTAAKPRTPAGEEKAKTPKKKAAAAAAAKKPAGPKKAKSPKKKATSKSPKKAATKPKKAKTPKKTAAKKTKTPKKASEKK